MKIIEEKNNIVSELKTSELNLSDLAILKNELAMKIIKILSEENLYPKQIAKKLNIHEQKIYYYIKKLEGSKIIKIIDKVNIQGSFANIYTTTSDSFFVKIKDLKKSNIEYKTNKSLEPFIEEGKLNCLIVVGSPDSHGKNKARAKDGHTAIELALFLGKYVNNITTDIVRLDTEITTEEIKGNNLILVGGPNVNSIFEKINEKLPIKFSKTQRGINSEITKKNYPEDEIGLVGKIINPFNNKKEILFFAGNRQSGTKASILFFTRYFEDFNKTNRFDKNTNIRIVEGIDLNSDGIIDDIEILE